MALDSSGRPIPNSGLDKIGYNIPFGQGLDTKQDPWQVSAGKMLQLQNVVFDTDNLLKKRNGFPLYSSLPDKTSTTLTVLNGNLLATGSNLQAYSQDTQQWINRGSITPVNLATIPLVRTSNSQTVSDSCTIANGLCCEVNTDSAGNSYYSVQDSVTGQIVQQLTQLPTTAVSPKVVNLTSYFIVTYLATVGGTPHLQFIAIPTANPAGALAAQDISTQVGSLASGYDIIVTGTTAYISWDSSDSGGGVRTCTLSSTLVASSSVLIANKKAALLSLAVDSSGSTPIIWLAFYDSTGVQGYVAAYTSLLAAYLTPVSFLASAIVQLSSYVVSGVLQIVYETANTYSAPMTAASNFLSKKTATRTSGSTATISSATVMLRSVGLASKLFSYSSVVYMLATYAGKFQPTYFLIDLNGNIYSRLASTNSAGYCNSVTLPSVSLNGSMAQLSYLTKTLIQAVNKAQGVANVAGIYAQTGINLASFTINTVQQYSSEIASSLHLTGGQLWQYDGIRPVEHNFHVYPEDLGAAQASTGGFMIPQQYYYISCYEWTDGQGLLHRSAPSVPFGVLVGAGTSTNTVTVSVPMLRLTAKNAANPVRIVLYRWSTAQQNYYQVTSITAPNISNTTSEQVAIVDTLADSSILGNTLIYTTGGVVEDGPADASIASTLWNGRYWYIKAEDRNTLGYSKQVLQGTPVELAPLFSRYVAPTLGSQGPTGGMTAIAPLDDKLIIFKNSALYYETGLGPDNTGAQNDFSNPIYITGSIGCSNPNSIVMMPAGLMFQTDKGIWLLGRDLSTKYIGKDVQAFNSSKVLSAACIPGTNQVRFVLDSGITLMYDYDQAQWGTFVGAPAISSCLYNGYHTLLNKYGQVLQEKANIYLDNTSPVLISLTTAWLKVTNLQGFQRAYRAYILGNYISPHKLNVQVAYNYEPAALQTDTIVPTNYVSSFGSDPTFGASATYGGTTTREQWEICFKKQKCESVQLTITEIYDGSKGVAVGAGLTMSGINIIFGSKRSYPKLKAANSVG